jgi:hypothetical protein
MYRRVNTGKAKARNPGFITVKYALTSGPAILSAAKNPLIQSLRGVGWMSDQPCRPDFGFGSG